MIETPVFDEVAESMRGALTAGEFRGRQAERLALAHDLRKVLASKSLRRELEQLASRLEKKPES